MRGFAHFPGTGPEGTKCSECVNLLMADLQAGDTLSVEYLPEGTTRFFLAKGGQTIDATTVGALHRKGLIEPVDDGLLPGFPQTYRLIEK